MTPYWDTDLKLAVCGTINRSGMTISFLDSFHGFHGNCPNGHYYIMDGTGFCVAFAPDVFENRFQKCQDLIETALGPS